MVGAHCWQLLTCSLQMDSQQAFLALSKMIFVLESFSRRHLVHFVAGYLWLCRREGAVAAASKLTGARPS